MVLIDSMLELDLDILGYTEKKEAVSNPFNLNYLGCENDSLFQYLTKEYDFIIGIGENKIRSNISTFLRDKSEHLINITDKTSIVSNTVIMGSGNFIAKNATISTFSVLGNDIIINTSSSIDHHCLISDGAHVGPGAVLCGNVKIGKNTFVGANTVIKQGVIIGENVTIGAGSVVIKNIPSNETWVGNPAKQIKKV